MNIFWSIFLGILQGLTEFIPVSSSGHLVLAQGLIPGFSQPGVLFDVVLHLATLIAVFYFFRKTIIGMSRKYLMLLIIGTIWLIQRLQERYSQGTLTNTTDRSILTSNRINKSWPIGKLVLCVFSWIFLFLECASNVINIKKLL